jgi:hypothetical protein
VAGKVKMANARRGLEVELGGQVAPARRPREGMRQPTTNGGDGGMVSVRAGSDATNFGDSIIRGGCQSISWNGVLWRSI